MRGQVVPHRQVCVSVIVRDVCLQDRAHKRALRRCAGDGVPGPAGPHLLHPGRPGLDGATPARTWPVRCCIFADGLRGVGRISARTWPAWTCDPADGLGCCAHSSSIIGAHSRRCMPAHLCTAGINGFPALRPFPPPLPPLARARATTLHTHRLTPTHTLTHTHARAHTSTLYILTHAP